MSRRSQKDSEIEAGVKMRMTCLNAGEELKYGGSDTEIAQILHNACVTHKKNKATREACNVVTFINTRSIGVYDIITGELLFSFRLIDVRDITKGLGRHSKISVLVAREYNEASFKAYVFYSKKTPACFYNVIRRAFQRSSETFKYLNCKNTAEESWWQLNGSHPYTTPRRENIFTKNSIVGAVYNNLGLFCESTDISNSEDEEFEAKSEQTCLIHSSLVIHV
ncbi:uncharacterized protein LOC114528245 [Dendronephthya gigantea]|uniref:uncharacterized protein LOC114528245 n=1 Tax=Dendronephthya gigantea TaxID=151771 RepID=UPI00106B78FD|nr:uncharacterized protein LOC114528245 [Dendronephthya gigantea]